MSLNKLFAVARWEYIEKVKSKVFLVGLLLTPIVMIGMGIVPTLLATQEDKDIKNIGLIDQSGLVAVSFAQGLESRYHLADGQPNYMVRTIATGSGAGESSIDEGSKLVLSNEIEGFVIIGPSLGNDSLKAEYRSKSVGDVRLESRIDETLRDCITTIRAQKLGLDKAVLKNLMVELDLKKVKLAKTGEVQDAGFEKVFFSAFIFLMMMFFMIATSGQLLVRSVIEEKSNRIVEVLVSSCSPSELMAGKILGLSGLGLTQLVVWAIIGLGISAKTGNSVVNPADSLILVVYFILGYLFYAAVFIAAGSPLSTEQEAQQINSYLIILLILPMMLALPAMQHPEALWIRIMSFVPFFTPTMMALRVPIQMPEPWEIILTIVLMLISIYGAMIAAGRIFRIGILSTGKNPGLATLWRWVRTGS
jgi:ABC-2 type transport system permease protein